MNILDDLDEKLAAKQDPKHVHCTVGGCKVATDLIVAAVNAAPALVAALRVAPRNLTCERIPEGFSAPVAEFEAAACGECQTCRFNAALDALMSDGEGGAVGEACALCDHNPACGMATVTVPVQRSAWEGAWDTLRLCHTDECESTRRSMGQTALTCYHRWTVYGERKEVVSGVGDQAPDGDESTTKGNP
jgi:hypothetical protein